MKKKKASRYVKFARLALQMCEQSLDKYSHRNSPKRYTQPQLVAACLLGFYLNLSYRDLEEWLLASDKVCQVLGLNEVPDHCTFCRAFQRLRQPQSLAYANAEYGIDMGCCRCHRVYAEASQSLLSDTRWATDEAFLARFLCC